MTARSSTAGVTLVEMLVALVLFALVGLASFTTLDAIIRTRDRTEGRLEQIARYDRALILFSRDVMQAAPSGISFAEGALVLPRRPAPELLWRLEDGQLQRLSTTSAAAQDITQIILNDVEDVQFRFLDDALDWHVDWAKAEEGDPALYAIEMTVELAGDGGSINRLVEVAQPVPVGDPPNVLSGALGGPAQDTAAPDADIVPEGN